MTVSVDRWSYIKMAKKDPFPNDWDEVYNIDESDIVSPPFIDVLQDSVLWDLPDPYVCVVRSYNRKESKLREFAYKREGVAQSKILELANNGEEITVLTQDFIGTINYKDV